MSALIAVGRVDLRTYRSFSIDGQARLGVGRVAPTCSRAAGSLSLWLDHYLKLSVVRSTVRMVNSERVVTPSRHG